MKLFDMFAGVGGFRLAFQREGFEPVGWCEIDKWCQKLYRAYYRPNREYFRADILAIDPRELPDFDIITAGIPCFPPDTEVFTLNGFKKISNISIGDMVLSHDAKFHRVREVTVRYFDGELIEIHPRCGIPPIRCTPEHPILVAHRVRKWDNSVRKYRYYWVEEWKRASEITKDDFLVAIPYISETYIPMFINRVKVNQYTYIEETLPLTDRDFWYLVGFYLAEGYLHEIRKPNGRVSKRVIWCCGVHEIDRITKKVRKVFGKVTISKDHRNPKAVKLIVGSSTLYNFLKQFGKYAHAKEIPNFVYFLPRKLKRALAEGYFDGDGYIENNTRRAVTVSEKLAYGMQRLLATVDGVFPYVIRDRRNETHVIEGRVVRQRDTFRIGWNTNKRNLQFVNGFKLYIRIKDISRVKYKGEVYNLEVEGSQTYTVGSFFVVHNCQPFSYAGKRRGMRDERGLPLWKKFFEIVKSVKPKIVVIENVKGLLSSNRGWDFAWVLHKMDEIGYDTEWDVLNSKDFGVPQNRERVFIIGHLRGESRPEVFPLEESDRVHYEICRKNKEKEEVVIYSPFNDSYRNIAYSLSTNVGSPLNVTGQLIVVGDRIRKLTPLECFRLQGFPDDIVRVARKIGISDTQLYKMAGNAVTVPVVQSIARAIRKLV